MAPAHNLHFVALAQKALIYIIAAQILIYLVMLATDPPALLAIALLIGLFGTVFAGLAAVVVLASATGRSVVGTVLIGIGLFIPIISLIVMLVVNARATRLLREAGCRVGFFGVRTGEIRALRRAGPAAA